MLRFFLYLIFIFSITKLYSITEYYHFDSKLDSKRFDNLVHILRCPTCPNQSIYDSNSLMSESIRDEVFDMIKVGYNDDAIVDKLILKYKEYILYKPKYNGVGIWLWVFPLLLVLIGLLILINISKKFRNSKIS